MLHDSLMASTRAQVLYTGQKFPIGKNAPYENRSRAHLFITVLAYHAVHLIRTRLRNNDINLRWDSIRNRMDSWRRVTTTQQTPTGQQVVVRQDARPSDEAATIARYVNVHVGAYRQRL